MAQIAHDVYTEVHPKQEKFMDCGAKYRLFGGAKGGGKSRGMRMEAVKQCLAAPNVRGLALRRTNKEIEENMVTPMLGELPNNIYTYNATDNIITFHNGSTLRFGYCKNMKDVIQYQGVEYDFICIEELTHWNEKEFKTLKTSLRTVRKGIMPNFFASSNPGGIGHAWVKRIWIQRKFDKRERPDEFAFIPAKVWDNPTLIDNDPSYLENLEDLDEVQRAAFLHGNWDVFEGQYFTEFNQDIYVISPHIPKKEEGVKRRIISGDYGSKKPCAIYWMAQDNQNNVTAYRELYAPFLYADLAEAIVANTTEEEAAEITEFHLDPSLFGKENEETGNTGAEVIDRKFAELGFNARCVPAINNRLDGWRLMKALLHPRPDPNNPNILRAKLRFTKNCMNAIRTIPEMIHDEKNVEDLDTTLEDHPADGGRYGLMAFGIDPASLAEVAEIQDVALIATSKHKEQETEAEKALGKKGSGELAELYGTDDMDDDNILTEGW